MTRIPHQPRILRQNPPRNRHTRRPPLAQSPINLLHTNIHIDPVPLRINRNHIAVLHHRNRPAHRGLGTHVAHNEAVRGPAVAAVGDQGDVGEARAHYGGGGFELFGHAWGWVLVCGMGLEGVWEGRGCRM
jgi:hypothetical protein